MKKKKKTENKFVATVLREKKVANCLFSPKRIVYESKLDDISLSFVIGCWRERDYQTTKYNIKRCTTFKLSKYFIFQGVHMKQQFFRRILKQRAEKISYNYASYV